MKSSIFFKVASGLLAFFGMAHTFGMFTEDEGEIKAVVSMMRSVHFDAMGTSRTVFDFYFGFGLLLTLFLLFSSVLSWQLGNLSKEQPAIARRIAWPFAVAILVVAVLCWMYFFIAPQVIASLAAVCLIAGAITIKNDV
ncbi:hypothetical protein HUU42_11495 [bacterium]|nr:hypothetical protein [bacterium]